jgi:hypothetical protein
MLTNPQIVKPPKKRGTDLAAVCPMGNGDGAGTGTAEDHPEGVGGPALTGIKTK